VPEPAPDQPDPTRPAVQETAQVDDTSKSHPTGRIAVARRLESSPVISKSYRVRELPPPPVVVPPQPYRAESDAAPSDDTLPDGLRAPPEQLAAPPIELDALQIRTLRPWSFLRPRVRIPPRWQRWLADPQRRNSVSVALSIAVNLVLVAVLALVLRSPQMPATEVIPARFVQPAVAEAPAMAQERLGQLPEPLVRQVTSGALETVAIDSPHAQSEISNLKSEILNPEPRNPVDGRQPPRPRMEPPAWTVDAPAAPHASSDAHPAVAPQTVISAEDRIPGMESGSRPPPDLLQAVDSAMQGKLKRRTPSGRSEGVRYGGGTPQSEEAVERAIRWLAAHQRQDGSWNFNHLGDACQHYCTHPGSEGSTTAATGLALLPFFGAGYTHKEGEYQDVVQRGLDYLKNRGIKISYGNDLRDGSMYGHALATIALCEAYGMTRDSDQKEAAQGALDYISYAQDNNTGGWRYNPGEPGDTTVTGWMLMALKSGQMARLNTKTPTIFAAQRFLDSVQNQDGSQYGYQSRKPRPATTAVGLLCRMYTGWRHSNPGLVQGVAHLNAWGPAKDSLYYDYYATQVLFHWAGPEWDTWNRKMRENLISNQERVGHQTGSWYFESQQSAAGGRLYNTAMATMILEVYYRFMPLYGAEAVRR